MRKTSIKTSFVAVGLAVLASGIRTEGAGEPWAQWHFAGASAVLADTNAAKLKTIAALPASAEVRTNFIAKLGAALPAALNLDQSTETSAALQALAAEFWQWESFGEVAADDGRGSLAVAVAVPAANEPAWKQQLATLKKSAAARLAQTREGKWTVVALGENAEARLASLTQNLKSGQHLNFKPDAWLELRLNLPALAGPLGLPLRQDLPQAELSWSSKADNVRVNGALRFARPVAWKSEPWAFPTNTIYDPLVSFTAGNGLAPWLAKTRIVEQLKLAPVPNQFCAWGNAGIAFLTFVATPVKDSTNLLSQMAVKVPPLAFQAVGKAQAGNIFWLSNRAELVWQGLPIMAPNLRAWSDKKSEYLITGLFPLSPKGKTPPPELFAQLAGRGNVVYYDWEITEARVHSWRQFFQLAPLFTELRQVPANYPGQKWLPAVAPLLGNTVTEITSVTPTEMAFTRRGHLALTGFELNLLARGLDLWGTPPEFGTFKRPDPSKAPKTDKAKTAK